MSGLLSYTYSHIVKLINLMVLMLLILFGSMISTVLSNLMKEGFDVKALRAFRVLRPLRLVSGVPSKSFS